MTEVAGPRDDVARPPAIPEDAVTTVFAGGASLDRPLWLGLRLAAVLLATRRARWPRRRRGRPVASRLPW